MMKGRLDMEPVHKLKDNVYKLIFGESEMFVEFLKSFIPIELLKDNTNL